SVRGARGGFMLARPADRIALLHIYEAIEGPIPMGNCLFAAPVCKQRDCILGELLESVNSQFVDYMARTRLADLASSLPATRSAPAAGREG
ncbi:MAG: Rrf2 family transcriptional regulator, partial [Armatimonadota bacterium]